MHKLHVTEILNMAGRKKGLGNKCRGERVQVHATFTFQQAAELAPKKDSASAGSPDSEDSGGCKDRGAEKDRIPKVTPGTKVVSSERLSFAEHAIKILDHMMKERSVGELLKLGPREEMLGLTPLSMAAAVGHVEGTRKLLEAGAAVDDKSSDGSTALLNAAHWRHLPVLDLLLQHGACVAATNNEGNNALMIALRHGDVRAVNSLWPHRKSLDINHSNNDGNTALHLAAERKWESCVQFLIQNGADVNKQNNSGQTALHIGASKGDHPTAERLLAAGASLLLEDHCGNNPFCLSVRGFHDVLAGYFLSKLKPEDKLYFCKRRVHKLQTQLSTESSMAWNVITFLTSDASLRDSLFQCDVIRVAVQALNRRGLLNEVAVQSCLVCSDLMYNPFPVPDLRFVKQFLTVHGPEAVLDRLESRGQEHVHNLDCKELSHLQGHLQGQLQSRQQQVDFNTAFILLPVMAMAETSVGRDWFAEANNQQRIATHLRRVTSYRELLQLVGIVQQEMCGREVKVDRVAVMERFITFFNTLENRDREEKVRQLLEQEEREKSRKEKKREKKRQQRLKQKLKSKANDMASEEPASKENVGLNDNSKIKSQPLDALDDIPLTVGPDGVQDVPSPASAIPPLGLAQDVQGSDDEWVMVGGKRCYPPKTRTGFTPGREDNTREQDQNRAGEVSKSQVSGVDAIAINSSEDVVNIASTASTTPTAVFSECDGVDGVGIVRQSSTHDLGSKMNKAGKRWADVARNGSINVQMEDSGLSSPSQTNIMELDSPSEEKTPTQKSHSKKEAYHEQFPSLNQPSSADGADHQHLPASGTQQGDYGVEVLGAAHQFLDKLCSSGRSFVDRLPRGESLCAPESLSAPSANLRMDPSLLYEALTGWMWQAAVSRGLINPDTDPTQFFTSSDFWAPLTSQYLKSSPTTLANQHNVNTNPAMASKPVIKSSSDNRLGHMTSSASAQMSRNESSVKNTQSSSSTLVKDWFDMTNTDPSNVFAPKAKSLSSGQMDGASLLEKLFTNQADVAASAALSSMSSHTLTGPSNHAESAGVARTNKPSPEASNTGFTEKDPFLWPGSDFSHWLPAHSSASDLDRASSSRVCGKPVLDSNDLCGLAFTPDLDSLDSPLPRFQQPLIQTSNHQQSDSRFLAPRARNEEKDKNCKEFDTGADVFKQTPMFDSLAVKEKAVPGNDYNWLLQDPVKARIKTAVVSVPRSPDSYSTQSSSSEHRNDGVPEDMFSVKSDTSHSSCLNDSFHHLSPSDSGTSSLTGLHECLAPGFIRAAVGDSHKRPFGNCEESMSRQETKSTVLAPLLGNIGLLPSQLGVPESDARRRMDSQYPDLSVVPEREQPVPFPTHLPKALQVVGQGRPARSEGQRLDSQVSGYPPELPKCDLNQTSLIEDSAFTTPSSSASAPSDKKTSDSVSIPPIDRPESPDVLFPESLRDDEADEQPQPVEVFPSIHDMNERDLFQDVFSNSYFLEQIAIDQIRRWLRAMGDGDEVLRANSVLFHDLDYYASLYGVRLRDILGPPVEDKPARAERALPKKMLYQSVPAWKAVVKELGRRMNSKEDLRDPGDLELPVVWEDPPASEWPWSGKVTAPQIVTGGDGEGDEGWWQEGGGSRRWRKWLRQILDLPWTMRRQFGKIVLPARSMEFNISRTGHHPLILGFLTDGTEVGVLALDRTRHALDTRLMATVAADSEPDVHFILRYKAVWECAGRVYLAMELCDYTLDEYVGIVRLDHRQDPLSANRLAWQLLKGLKYLHSNFAVPHGNLMPGWIFVDCDGRLRLAGYGLRDVTASARAGSKDHGERSSIEGDCRYWRATEHVPGSSHEPSFQADIQVAGMLLHYILTGGRHPYGDTGPEVEGNLSRNAVRQQRVSQEADHLVTIMTLADPLARPAIDTCLKQPFFWSGEKRFRLVLIVGSDILTEMKTGVPLTGAGSASMVDILNVVHITTVSENWLGEVDPVLVKEMRAFRQYKNNLPELVLFVYNCCLHYDKMSTVAKEVLDDPCKYFQSRFTGLFMAVYRAMRASDRTDRTCYKPFF